MPIETPTYNEITERIKSDIANELPDVDPTIFGSFVRAFAVSNAGRHYDNAILINQLIKELFPQTASGEFLERWAQYEGLSRIAAIASAGSITVTGVATTSIPALTEFTNAESTLVATTIAATLALQNFSISSLTRSGTTITGITTSDHNFATGLTITIAGAVETDYNGVFVITVIDTDTFTYEITGTPTTPATGTITASYTGASIPVEAIDPGEDGNLESGAQLQVTIPISGLDADAFTQFLGLTGGTDEETDTNLLLRTLQSRANPVANFNEAAIIKEALAVAGVTRVFVKRITPTIGSVTIAFMRDDDSNPIPDAGEIAEVETVIHDITPAQSDLADIIIQAPTPVSVNFTFTVISPDTSTMQTAITNSLVAFFRDEVDYETDVDEDKYRAAIINTIDPETGDNLQSFTLSTPTGDVTITT
ncbi:MAG: baseplate J/gp47 family protein, partial [Candidatus Peribacteraceae bacterium]|nr:baseplate J/gp47 family protein [Candidatus Peribacteraceae bacterium]